MSPMFILHVTHVHTSCHSCSYCMSPLLILFTTHVHTLCHPCSYFTSPMLILYVTHALTLSMLKLDVTLVHTLCNPGTSGRPQPSPQTSCRLPCLIKNHWKSNYIFCFFTRPQHTCLRESWWKSNFHFLLLTLLEFPSEWGKSTWLLPSTSFVIWSWWPSWNEIQMKYKDDCIGIALTVSVTGKCRDALRHLKILKLTK